MSNPQKYNKYTFEELKLGANVMFDSTVVQSNYDHFWTIIEKDEVRKLLIVELNQMEYKGIRWTIRAEDIRFIEPTNSDK